MQTKPPSSAETAALRRHAEARLRGQHPEPGPARTEADTQRLVHELQVHQIELEMQNDELQHARDTVEAGLEKYSDLYDFARVDDSDIRGQGCLLVGLLTPNAPDRCRGARRGPPTGSRDVTALLVIRRSVWCAPDMGVS